MPTADIKTFLKPYLPGASLDYCAQLWQQHPFHFTITRKRKTKLGDYRYHKIHKTHKITVNGDLNIYHFLVTYLHEVAHLLVRLQYGDRRVPPHGMQWKSAFQKLMMPVLNESVFPGDILLPLKKHMANPRATSYADLQLTNAFRLYDADNGHRRLKLVSELPIGCRFEINGRGFEKLKDNRTRAVCRDLKNGKKYLVSKIAEVRLLGK